MPLVIRYMGSLSWPDTITYTEGFRDHFSELADSVRNGGGRYAREHGFTEFDSGAGRVVYDISEHTSIPAVLRVAHNKVGIEETRKEEGLRNRTPTALRKRLVPVLDYGHGHGWSVQPKCDSVPHNEQSDHVDTITALVNDAGDGFDSREVYEPNIGLWGGEPVLFDYGGIFI